MEPQGYNCRPHLSLPRTGVSPEQWDTHEDNRLGLRGTLDLRSLPHFRWEGKEAGVGVVLEVGVGVVLEVRVGVVLEALSFRTVDHGRAVEVVEVGGGEEESRVGEVPSRRNVGSGRSSVS